MSKSVYFKGVSWLKFNDKKFDVILCHSHEKVTGIGFNYIYIGLGLRNSVERLKHFLLLRFLQHMIENGDCVCTDSLHLQRKICVPLNVDISWKG